jgi:cytoskeletal protein RodZ
MSESVGEKLRQARQERQLKLEQVARGTHLRLHYLEAMEAGEFDRLPSRAHARGFLRAYASFLDLDPQPLLVTLEGEAPPPPPVEPEPEEAAGEPEELSSAEVARKFAEIGADLQAQREILGLSLDDVERHTHLRQHYLLALEAGDLDGLPSPVQGRGMLQNYAAFLGLDPDPLLLKFADGLQARLAEKQAAWPRRARRAAAEAARPRPWGPLRRWVSGDFLLGGILILFLAGFVIWGAVRINAMGADTAPTATVPSIAEALMPTPEPSPSPTPTASPEPTALGGGEAPPPTIAIAVEATEGGEGEALPATTGEASQAETEAEAEVASGEAGELPGSAGSVQVYLTVNQRAWVRVTVDGEVELEGRVIPGSAYAFEGNQQVEILTGNGAALQVFYNQRDLGSLGIYGEEVNRIFTVEGAVQPTATITPTPAPTATITPTPQVTATGLPTSMP